MHGNTDFLKGPTVCFFYNFSQCPALGRSRHKGARPYHGVMPFAGRRFARGNVKQTANVGIVKGMSHEKAGVVFQEFHLPAVAPVIWLLIQRMVSIFAKDNILPVNTPAILWQIAMNIIDWDRSAALGGSMSKMYGFVKAFFPVVKTALQNIIKIVCYGGNNPMTTKVRFEEIAYGFYEM